MDHGSNERRFECRVCKRKFNVIEDLHTHIEVWDHKVQMKKKQCCKMCGESFKTYKELQAHIKENGHRWSQNYKGGKVRPAASSFEGGNVHPAASSLPTTGANQKRYHTKQNRQPRSQSSTRWNPGRSCSKERRSPSLSPTRRNRRNSHSDEQRKRSGSVPPRENPSKISQSEHERGKPEEREKPSEFERGSPIVLSDDDEVIETIIIPMDEQITRKAWDPRKRPAAAEDHRKSKSLLYLGGGGGGDILVCGLNKENPVPWKLRRICFNNSETSPSKHPKSRPHLTQSPTVAVDQSDEDCHIMDTLVSSTPSVSRVVRLVDNCVSSAPSVSRIVRLVESSVSSTSSADSVGMERAAENPSPPVENVIAADSSVAVPCGAAERLGVVALRASSKGTAVKDVVVDVEDSPRAPRLPDSTGVVRLEIGLTAKPWILPEMKNLADSVVHLPSPDRPTVAAAPLEVDLVNDADSRTSTPETCLAVVEARPENNISDSCQVQTKSLALEEAVRVPPCCAGGSADVVGQAGVPAEISSTPADTSRTLEESADESSSDDSIIYTNEAIEECINCFTPIFGNATGLSLTCNVVTGDMTIVCCCGTTIVMTQAYRLKDRAGPQSKKKAPARKH